MLIWGVKYPVFYDEEVAAGAFADPSAPVIEYVLGSKPVPIDAMPDGKRVIGRFDICDGAHVLQGKQLDPLLIFFRGGQGQ